MFYSVNININFKQNLDFNKCHLFAQVKYYSSPITQIR